MAAQQHRSAGTAAEATRHPGAQILATKNTFLDCRSPWLDPVELPQRPSSDPTSSTSSASNTVSGTGSSTNTPEGCDHFPADTPPLRPFLDHAPADSGARPADVFVRKTKAERRRIQRKVAKAMRAQRQGDDDPEAQRQGDEDPEALAHGCDEIPTNGVGVAEGHPTDIDLRGPTKISL